MANYIQKLTACLDLRKQLELEDPSTLFQVLFVDELLVTAVDIASETSKDTTLACMHR